jgi:hypothetical protein
MSNPETLKSLKFHFKAMSHFVTSGLSTRSATVPCHQDSRNDEPRNVEMIQRILSWGASKGLNPSQVAAILWLMDLHAPDLTIVVAPP